MTCINDPLSDAFNAMRDVEAVVKEGFDHPVIRAGTLGWRDGFEWRAKRECDGQTQPYHRYALTVGLRPGCVWLSGRSVGIKQKMVAS